MLPFSVQKCLDAKVSPLKGFTLEGFTLEGFTLEASTRKD